MSILAQFSDHDASLSLADLRQTGAKFSLDQSVRITDHCCYKCRQQLHVMIEVT